MVGLERDLKDFEYKPYIGKTEILKDGKHTGKFTMNYGNSVPYTGNLSTPSGQTNQMLSGLDTPYTHVLLLYDSDADIEEDGLIECNGRTYEIKAVRQSPNICALALKRIVGGAS